ncbi:response regulator transcription factor [Pseudomonadales bacterium]|nr:response regulator transcription factor [Pseudomonadales bacterium]MDC6448703.1 response regulator transcription factor [Pseudomonadales bacterium]
MIRKLLLIEDDDKLRQQLVELLESHRYEVDVAADGMEGLYIAQKFSYDIAVIDLGLPKVSGMEIIEKIRGDGKDFPILVLTARGDWSDKVDALGIGADDYLVKPFHVQEFLARLDALVRRASGQFKPSLSIGPINLDMRGKRVAVDGEAIELTAYEFNLLEYLMQRPGEVVSKTELTEYLYEQDFDRDSNVIEVFVGRLRKKLDPKNSLKPISTVRGQGYRLALSTR